MSVYMITRLTIHDRSEYDKYADRFMEIFEKYDGKLLSVDEEPQVVGGEWNATRSVLIEFPSAAAAIDAYNSDSYKDALATLGDAADRDIRVLNGL